VDHQVLTAADATVQQKQESTSPWICCYSSSGYLVILDVSWHQTTALKFFPVIRVALLMGFQRTVINSFVDRGTVDPESASVKEDDTDLRRLRLIPLLRLAIKGCDLAC
jgi:hypothetical protein